MSVWLHIEVNDLCSALASLTFSPPETIYSTPDQQSFLRPYLRLRQDQELHAHILNSSSDQHLPSFQLTPSILGHHWDCQSLEGAVFSLSPHPSRPHPPALLGQVAHCCVCFGPLPFGSFVAVTSQRPGLGEPKFAYVLPTPIQRMWLEKTNPLL